MNENNSEKSKTVIPFVLIRIIIFCIFILISYLVAMRIYQFSLSVDKTVGIILSVGVFLFIMIVVQKIVTEYTLKIFKKFF